MIKKLRKYLLRFLLGMIFVVAVYFLLACLLSRFSTNPAEVKCDQKKEIFISTNGVHLDIVIPRKEIPENLAVGVKMKTGTEYLAFGWGDKGFYLETPTWSDLKLSIAIKAMLLKSETAMHVTNYKFKKDKWYSLKLCDAQVELLLDHIHGSFQLDSNLNFISIPDSGYTENDYFFEAYGNYNGIHTCNNWVNDALKKAQVKTAIWSPFDKGVLRHLK